MLTIDSGGNASLLTGTEWAGNSSEVSRQGFISMGYYKKDVTPLLMYWSHVFLAITHWYAVRLF